MEKHSGAIANGEVLNKRYQTLNILGSGGFGITYRAIDLRTEMIVAIKEYFPSNLVYRLKNSKNIAINSPKDKKTFDWGLNSFIKEAQILANLNHRNIVQIDDFFEENNTAYFVMPYVVGISLEDYAKKIDGGFEEAEIYNIIMPILDGLKEAHNNNVLHRDIKPANILICQNKEPLLIDFGAAKDTIGKRTNTSKIILSPPFAPMEQYGNTLPDDKYTDIYAVGMVLYILTTQKSSQEIPTAIDRMDKDWEKLEFSKEVGEKYSETLLNATKKAIEVQYKNRPQNVDEMIELMLEAPKPHFEIPWVLMSIVTVISTVLTFGILKYLGV